MKKLLISFVVVIVVVIAAVLFMIYGVDTSKKSDEKTFHTGVLAYQGTNEDEFQSDVDKFREFASADVERFSKDSFIKSLIADRRIFHFYNSLMALMMDLKAGKINEMILPDSVGRYLISRNSLYKNSFSTAILTSNICFGFKENNIELQEKFNTVLKDMKEDGTLEKFAGLYVKNLTSDDPDPTRPKEIDNAPELKIAITGDMPPIDMFAGDGKPTGYSTAVLSEIGKRLNMNIKFINTDAGGRSAALFSGRADVVFWYRAAESNIEGEDPLENICNDAPQGVILSMPYYSWDNEFIIRIKSNQGLLEIF